MITKFHNYYLLSPSPWPLISMFNAFGLLFSMLLFLKFGQFLFFLLFLMNLSISSFFWWFSYSKEINFSGEFSSSLEKGLKFSMILFISSEVFFFFSFFWSYFHYFLSPTLEISGVWPPMEINMFDCLNVPLINTLVLLSSGATVTASHHYLINSNYKMFNFYLFVTVFLGILFSFLQWSEYQSSFFGISDSSFGTTFFMLTGFHGIHVLIGTIFLLVNLILNLSTRGSKEDYSSFELAAWYWHFVDVVWIFLYFSLYYLNN